ncbi:MAG: LysE family translocator [Xanthomonadales bacterium]|nr:LysE family translocator [Xanthomonadales bacterium]
MLTTWISVAIICALGAMSPGPSLVVVLRHTLRGGRARGATAAVAHSIGIGLYAFLAMSGLAVLITASPDIFRAFQWAGAAYLAWLGIKGLLAKPAAEAQMVPSGTNRSAARDGFFVAFLNPKIAVFLVALFSQVVGPDTSWLERTVYASTAWLIDMLWYLMVAWLFSNPAWLKTLQRNAVWFERAFGIVLLALAARLVVEALG